MTRAPIKQARAGPSLDRDRIGEAALALVQAEGRSALSMRALARALGCEAMSLYHHVDGIEGVLDAIVNRLFVLMMEGHPRPRSPRQRLETYARAYLDLADAFPKAFPLLATRLLHVPAAHEVMHTLISSLRDMGLPPRAALRQIRILGAYLNGAGLALSAWRTVDGEALDARRTVAADPRLEMLAAGIDETTVRADLHAGLMQLLASISAQARRNRD